MDPVSHVAFGRTLVALDGRRALGPGAIAASVLGSLTPDLDAVLMPFGWDLYLRVHQGGTHSLIGSVACAALTAAVVRLPTEHGHYARLFLAAWAGAAGHLFLDVISGADVRFFWPFGSAVALPLFAMADPWLAGVLVLGLVTLALRRRSSARAAAAILIAVTLLSGAKALLYAKAQGRDDTSAGPVQFRRADVEWGSLTRWITYETRADAVEARRVNALTGTVTPLIHLPRGLDDPLVVRSRELAAVRNAGWSCGPTFATVARWIIVRRSGRRSHSAPVHPFPARSGSAVNSIPRRASPGLRLSTSAISCSAGRSADRTARTRRLANGVPSSIG
jgi:membrane-bound metal-dependent hydrolase YbcI (DUF457 family)